MTRFRNTNGAYIIAEVGINHNGDLGEAKKLIREAARAGADGVKIQVRDLESVYTKAVLEDSLKAEHGTQYLLSELRKAALTYDDVRELFKFAKDFDIDFFATPFDIKSARFLDELGMELFKVGSPDMTNLPLLAVIASFGKPMIVSTGMSDEAEIAQVAAFLKEKKADFSLLHCNSTYPVANATINLRYIPVMKEKFGVTIGYSSHEQGHAPTLAAIAMGAQIVERHITSDPMQSGPDHRSSLTGEQFAAMVADIRIVEESLGKPQRIFNQGEKTNRVALAKSLVAARDLKAGTVLAEADIVAKTPAKGASPLRLGEFIGKTLVQDLAADQYLDPSQLDSSGAVERSRFDINRTWGIVGRLNDFRDFLDLKPDLVEIHMTWRDLFDYARPAGTFPQDLVVHAPEYFQDELIDFTSEDKRVTDYSLEMLKRTIDVAVDMNDSFKGQKDPRGPRVVVHPGGHFRAPTDSNKTEQYRLLKKRLKEIDSRGVRLLVENMPPEPWYFGGQWHNTVFMDGREIAQFAGDMGWGICYDTSHAGLYCNYAGIPFEECTKAVLDHIAYLHVSDSRGSTEEGLQIGTGEIDFEQFFAMVSKVDTGFIPEVWQGHLNRGEGFREALGRLEKILKTVSGPSCSDPHCHIKHAHTVDAHRQKVLT